MATEHFLHIRTGTITVNSFWNLKVCELILVFDCFNPRRGKLFALAKPAGTRGRFPRNEGNCKQMFGGQQLQIGDIITQMAHADVPLGLVVTSLLGFGIGRFTKGK